jgi:cytosine/adenosine deaminase-related metal-dependent hydrolase
MDTRVATLLTNARLGSVVTNVRIVGDRIVAIGGEGERGDRIVDVGRDRLLPGLINAHDHLQLNGFPRQKYRDHYQNVRDWIADVSARREENPQLRTAAARARDERLLLGGLKNLLSGVTTVAHHDPFYDFLRHPEFPVRVVSDYGWAHSLHIDGDASVQQSHRDTPSAYPWIIHAAEGIDAEASGEFDRLDALGCIGPNTLLVHGVGLTRLQRERLVAAGAGLIWCPISNLHLFERTAQVSELITCGCVALGSDSRMSGGRDLLSELQVAHEVARLDDETLESLVTSTAAKLLRLPDRGEVRVGALADLIVLPADTSLRAADRAAIRLVMIGGRVRYAEIAFEDVVALDEPAFELTVDGQARVLDARLGALVTRASILEQDLAGGTLEWRAA